MSSATQLISERVMLKSDQFFAVSAKDGSINPAQFAGDGVWFGDTRILSGFRLLIDGLEPEATDLHTDDGWTSFELEGAGVHVTRVRFVDGGLRERITITNHGQTAVDKVVEVEVTADFAAILAIRGATPDLPPAVPAPAIKTVAVSYTHLTLPTICSV